MTDEPRRADLPCHHCGRSADRFLTLDEALERHRYGASNCFACKLTDLHRAAARNPDGTTGGQVTG